MNDTKWREVFCAISRFRVRFTIAFVGEAASPQGQLHFPVPERLLRSDHIADPGIGGPCYYRDILGIAFPRIQLWDLPGTQELPLLLDELTKLGQLPISETDETVEIRGYQ